MGRIRDRARCRPDKRQDNCFGADQPAGIALTGVAAAAQWMSVQSELAVMQPQMGRGTWPATAASAIGAAFWQPQRF